MSKNFNVRRGQTGFIKTVVSIVIALIVLAYFGFDIQDKLDRGTLMSILESLKFGVLWTWTHIIKNPAIWIWREIITEIVWQKFLLVGWEWVRAQF